MPLAGLAQHNAQRVAFALLSSTSTEWAGMVANPYQPEGWITVPSCHSGSASTNALIFKYH